MNNGWMQVTTTAADAEFRKMYELPSGDRFTGIIAVYRDTFVAIVQDEGGAPMRLDAYKTRARAERAVGRYARTRRDMQAQA